MSNREADQDNNTTKPGANANFNKQAEQLVQQWYLETIPSINHPSRRKQVIILNLPLLCIAIQCLDTDIFT